MDPGPLADNALTVLAKRYLGRDTDGRVVESPAELLSRVAAAVAAAEAPHGSAAVAEAEEHFRRRLFALEFLPNSPTLMNAGRPLGQLAACFVVPVGDSMEEIFDAVKWAARIQMSGGGTGFSFSRLRPAGDVVSSTKGVSSGPLAFMDVFNAATDAIKQGGMRRGANMGVLRVDHPDVLEFITAKLDPRRLTNFNVSVAITDAFMAALAGGQSYPLISPRTGAEVRRLDARRVFTLLVQSAWRNGDPGVIFIDRINALQPTPALGPIESTNPCAEEPLLPFESCVLGSINLAKFVRSPSPSPSPGGAAPGRSATASAANPADRIDWDRLGEAVADGVRFLDDVIDANRYPLPQIEAITKANRKIGLGVMGLADLFITLGLAYDEPAALILAEAIAAFIETRSVQASVALAEERGPFPNFERSRWAEAGHAPLRNATTTTVAPTGTISIIAGCSSGIEPLYAVSYQRHVLDGEVLVEVHPQFLALARAQGFWSDELGRIIAARGSVRGLAQVPEEVQRIFPTAHDIAAEVHIAMQAAFQRHVHAAVSKTVNLPASATPDDVARIYRRAYELGCKGVTIYRDKSRASQVLAFGGAAAAEPTPGARPEATPGAPAPEAAPLGAPGLCPECGQGLLGDRGCIACPACGWSKCEW
jgi:ribonucleoside-diphosphate reductase alpha chain